MNFNVQPRGIPIHSDKSPLETQQDIPTTVRKSFKVHRISFSQGTDIIFKNRLNDFNIHT